MKEYTVARTAGAPDWAQIPRAEISVQPWGGSYCPVAFGQLAWDAGAGLFIRMTCREEAPRALYTQPDDPVCRDSCLEAFLDLSGGREGGYLNVEANANGAALMGFGTQRHGRQPLRGMGCPLPQLQAFREGPFWGWQALVGLPTIRALWPQAAWAAGGVFYANLYKCGDDTDCPHYSVWNPVAAPQPDYHRPECFGRMTLA